MILTDREIQISLDMGHIKIDPRPRPEAFSSTSVDLTLDTPIKKFTPAIDGVEIILDPAAPGYAYTDAISQVTEDDTIGSGGYVLHPGDFVLLWTKEYIELPPQSRIAARVEGKSSLARLGVGVHITAPTIHAGFSGPVQLEVFSHGRRPVRLRPAMKICQLIFEQTLGVAEKGYSGQFLNQHA